MAIKRSMQQRPAPHLTKKASQASAVPTSFANAKSVATVSAAEGFAG
jgi:hypothetical protein